MNINLWQDAHIPKAVLPSCVWSSEYKVTSDGKLHSYVHQRSADVPLGLPFNITQYAILLSMYAKTCGYDVGTMSWSIMDAHIYVNQLEGIKRQLKRYQTMTEQVEMIKSSSDYEVENYYKNVCDYYDNMLNYAYYLCDIEKDASISKIKSALKSKGREDIADFLDNAYETKVCFEHLLTRDDPLLELASHESIFDYSTDFVSAKDPYLKENPIGNKDIKLKNYTPTPFIKMPIAQ